MRNLYIVSAVILSLIFSVCHSSKATALNELRGNIEGNHVLRDTALTIGKLTNLGPQVTMTTIQSAAFLTDKTGTDIVYTVVRGKPAHLIGFDLKTNKLVTDLPLDNMDGAWGATVASDGSFYAGGGGGHLYRYVPGSPAAEDLGKALGTETYIWDLAAGEDGTIYGASYPGCRIFSYHPEKGFTDVSKGPLVEKENYARSVVYDKAARKIYAGVGSHAHLIELDIETGNKRELLPEKYFNQEFVYDMRMVEGPNGENRLLANVTNIGKTLIYNLKSGRLEHELDAINVRGSIKSPKGNYIYYNSGNNLFSWDLSNAGKAPEKVAKVGAVLAMKWNTKNELYIFDKSARLTKYNTLTGTSTVTAFEIPPQPISINATALGPDGRIWTGGYLTGSNAAFDPATGKSVQYRGLSQTEGVTLQGHNMYFGIYPHGRLFVYDTRKPWSPADKNPKMIGKVAEQSRFYAGVSLEGQNKMFFGSVPEYGLLGGALVEYDTKTEKLSTYNNVVPKLSIVSLAHANGVVVGGTSVWGGLGIQPAVSEAVLFGWSPTGKNKIFELVPVAGAKAITCLINGPDGNIWGVADGTLFVFNLANRQVISRHQVFEVSEERKKSNVWHDVALEIHPSGQIYGTGSGQLFKIDPDTKKVTVLLKSASRLSMDSQGQLYFSRGSNLWQYIPAE